jgi:hypothetical protein
MPILNNNTVTMVQAYDQYSDSFYSTYPTDEKKYEWRTGCFEGFFVSSVEFCILIKYDDKDDRKVGPHGPQGPAGPQGLSDATGATRSSSLTSTS